MIYLLTTITDDFWKSFANPTVTLFIGILGFSTAVLTLIFSHYNNKRNYNFLLEKDRRDRDDRLKKDELDFAKDKRERQKAYNRVLGSFLKLYHSYLQHKLIFSETGVLNIPDVYLMQVVDKLDNLNAEIINFKKTVSEEASILPELTIYLHELLNLLGRFEMVVAEIPANTPPQDAAKAKLLVQRAHTFAVQELLDEYFSDLIEKMAIKAEVSEEFLKEIKEFNSPEAVERNIKIQTEILKRYLESLSRQTGQRMDADAFFLQMQIEQMSLDTNGK